MSLKILILPLTLVLTVIVFLFYVKPSFTAMMAAKKAAGEKKAQLDHLKSQTQKLEGLKTNWQSLEEKSLVNTALPETDDVDAYISEITSKANRSGVLLSEIKQLGDTDLIAPPRDYICLPSTGTALPQSDALGMAGSGGNEDSSGLVAAPPECMKTIKLCLAAKGTWQQLQDFFKYLEDMNRISNIDTLEIKTDDQVVGEQAPDLLGVTVNLTAFFKEKKSDLASNIALAEQLAGEGTFDQKALNKIKEIVYSAYDVPNVSPGGEGRNLFK